MHVLYSDLDSSLNLMYSLQKTNKVSKTQVTCKNQNYTVLHNTTLQDHQDHDSVLEKTLYFCPPIRPFLEDRDMKDQ